MVDWQSEDIFHPKAYPGEKPLAYKKRLARTQRELRCEYNERFENVKTRFFKPLGLMFEPVLRPNKVEKIKPYSANEVAHIKMFDTHRDIVRSYESLKSEKACKEARNHDGYRHPHQLFRAHRFNYKPCWFVQAHQPSYVVQDDVSRQFMIRKLLSTYQIIGREAEVLEEELLLKRATGSFSSKTFQHYRFWFFDIDKMGSWEAVRKMLVDLGLFDFLAMSVETSPGKFHIMFKSELIASVGDVANWTNGNLDLDKHLPYSAKYIQDLVKSKVALTNPAWKIVANRGVVDAAHVRDSNIPLPPHLSYDDYRGDDESFRQYLEYWGHANEVFKGDMVQDRVRVGQLPYYRNPKTGDEARIAYCNENAPRLTLAAMRSALRCGPTNVVLRDSGAEVVTADKPIPDFERETAREVASEEKAKTLAEKATAFKSMKGRLPVPSSPEEYAQQTGLTDDIKWGLDLTGSSNAMLLLFGRYAARYINLYNDYEIDTFFDQVVGPYFENRVSNDLMSDLGLKKFRYRFRLCCNKNQSENRIGPITKHKNSYTSQEMAEIIKSDVLRKVPEFFEGMSKTDVKHYGMIFNYIGERIELTYVSPITDKDDEKLTYHFFLPVAPLRSTVRKYALKLRNLERLGVFTRNNRYSIKHKKCKTAKLILAKATVVAFDQAKAGVKLPNQEAEEAFPVQRFQFEPDDLFALKDILGTAPDLFAKPEPKPEPVPEPERLSRLAVINSELADLELDPRHFATSNQLEEIDRQMDHHEAGIAEKRPLFREQLTIMNETSIHYVSIAVVRSFLWEARDLPLDQYSKFKQAEIAMRLLRGIDQHEREGKSLALPRLQAHGLACQKIPKDGMDDEVKHSRRMILLLEKSKLVLSG